MCHYGDVLMVDLDPSKGHEQRKRRPVVVVSNDAFNRTAPSLLLRLFPMAGAILSCTYPFPLFRRPMCQMVGAVWRMDSCSWSRSGRSISLPGTL